MEVKVHIIVMVLIEYDDDGNGIELVVCECIWFEQPIKRFHDEPSWTESVNITPIMMKVITATMNIMKV